MVFFFLCLILIGVNRQLLQNVVRSIEQGRRDPVFAILAPLLFVAIFVLALAISRRQFFFVDGVQAYMAYPWKLLQGARLPFDPFSAGRTISSLGANYFLQVLMLPTGDIRSVIFVDAGIGYFLLAALTYSLATFWRKYHALTFLVRAAG